MNNIQTAYFGGGCFWCTEAVFQRLKGVKEVVPGFAGGTDPNPQYPHIGDHAEVVKVVYDSSEIPFEVLLSVFFATHDPTSLNKQGFDTGPHYRSIILYTTTKQKELAQNTIISIENEKVFGSKIFTIVQELEKFYKAPDYHKDFYNSGKRPMYCTYVIDPKLKKLREKFKEYLDTGQKE